MNEQARRIAAGDVRALARTATGIENGDPRALAVLEELRPRAGRAIVVGITGSPGAGKSTLVDALARAIRGEGGSIGIIAVDPSSRATGGAILGDRIRMQGHHADAGIFIRSMATRGSVGGLARATADLATLLDAAGRDFVLIETVGVGQDEIEIAELARVTVLVLVPGMGDDVQAIKAGIMEIADIYVINKADHPGADRVEREVHSLLGLAPRANGWTPPVIKTVATDNTGVNELLAAIRACAEKGAGGRGPGAGAVLPEAGAVLPGAGAVLPGAGAVFQAPIPNPQPPTPSPVTIDHLGIAVRSLAAALPLYETLGLRVSHRETVEHEKVNVAMLPTGHSRIELLEPTEADSAVGRFLEKRGEGLHHVALRVPDLQAAVERLRAAGARLLNEPRAGAGGHLYVFVHPASAGGVLLELIQEED